MAKHKRDKVEPTPVEEWAKRFPYTPPPHISRGPSEPYRGPSKATRAKRAAKAKRGRKGATR